MSFTVSISARGKNSAQGVGRFLSQHYNKYAGNVDSVFGFAEHCHLYGGRPFNGRELSEDDVRWLQSSSIGFRIPMQNTVAGKAEYEKSKPFLEKYHTEGNSVILARKRFAEWIRRDFPLYHLEASVVSKIGSVDRLLGSLDYYDTVVPDHYWANDNIESIPETVRDRVRLFINAGCMYKCPNRVCYTEFSKSNSASKLARGPSCSSQISDYRHIGTMYDFDIDRFLQLGYSKFKALRENHFGTGY